MKTPLDSAIEKLKQAKREGVNFKHMFLDTNECIALLDHLTEQNEMLEDWRASALERDWNRD